MNNLELYNKVRAVPQEAKKQIEAGRLKGFTDINPMWRIKVLTEQFGPCGTGWYTDIMDKGIIEGANGEKVAYVDINLYVKGEEWSKPIYGTGGSALVAKEKNGLYTSDEAFKMAYTDALSIACKALGIGADVYFSKDRTKYDRPEETKSAEPQTKSNPLTQKEIENITYLLGETGTDVERYKAKYKVKSLAQLPRPIYENSVKLMEEAIFERNTDKPAEIQDSESFSDYVKKEFGDGTV